MDGQIIVIHFYVNQHWALISVEKFLTLHHSLSDCVYICLSEWLYLFLYCCTQASGVQTGRVWVWVEPFITQLTVWTVPKPSLSPWKPLPWQWQERDTPPPTATVQWWPVIKLCSCPRQRSTWKHQDHL